MIMNDLLNKADMIDELEIREVRGATGSFISEFCTPNKDIKDHLNMILTNNIPTDTYHFSPIRDEDTVHHRWVKKEIVKNVINIIINAKRYEDINKTSLNAFFIDSVSYTHHEDMTTSVKFMFRNSKTGLLVKKLLIEKLRQINGINIQEGTRLSLNIRTDKIKDNELQKHEHRTERKINQINEIFEL